jgi:hypothetical protein
MVGRTAVAAGFASRLTPRKAKGAPKVLFVPLVGAIRPDA